MSMILDSGLVSDVDITSEVLIHSYTFSVDRLIRLYMLPYSLNGTAANFKLRVAWYTTEDPPTTILNNVYGRTVTKPNATDTDCDIITDAPILCPFAVIGATTTLRVYLQSDNPLDSSVAVYTFITDDNWTASIDTLEPDVTAIKSASDTQTAETVKIMAAIYDDNTVDEDGIVTLSNTVKKQITTTGRTTVV